MICEEMLRQEEAGGSISDGAAPATGSAQEAAAACVAYGMLSEFASDFGALLAGPAAAPEQRAGVLAYLQANRMHACQRLLAAAGARLGAGEQRGSTHASAAQAAKAKLQPPPATASASAAAGGAAPARRLRLRDVVLGFSDAREAAYQVAKARRLEEGDYWSEALFVMTGGMGLLKGTHELLRMGDPSALVFLCKIWLWVLLIVFPAAVHRAARPVYLARRDWLWAASQLLAGCVGVVTREGLLDCTSNDRMNAAILNYAFLFAIMEIVVRPAMLRLSVPQQAVASIGAALSTYLASFGPPDGPYSLAACFAAGAAGVAWAGWVDARARRSWLLLVQQASVAAAVAGPGPSAAGDTKATKSLSRAAGP
jgi:hypothetical protein